MTIDIKHPGAFHKVTGTPEGQKIPEAKIQKELHSPNPHIRQEANFAENAKHFDHSHHVSKMIQHHNTHGHGE